MRSLRLSVRTPGFQPGKTGSIPVGTASDFFVSAFQPPHFTLMYKPQKTLGVRARLGYIKPMKHFTKHLAISAVLALSLSAPVLAADPEPIDFGPTEKLVILSETGANTFDVEVADTLKEQARGMMYRESVPPMTGMLFEFEEPKVATIWMKNTAVSLDILFVRSNGKILKIEHSATPYTLRNSSSEAPVAAVLEIGAGQSLELGIKPGDRIAHEFFGTEKLANAN